MHLAIGPGEFYTSFPGDWFVVVLLIALAVVAFAWAVMEFKDRYAFVGFFMLGFGFALSGALLWFVSGSALFINALGTMDSWTLPLWPLSVVLMCIAIAIGAILLVVWLVALIRTLSRRLIRKRSRVRVVVQGDDDPEDLDDEDREEGGPGM